MTVDAEVDKSYSAGQAVQLTIPISCTKSIVGVELMRDSFALRKVSVRWPNVGYIQEQVVGLQDVHQNLAGATSQSKHLSVTDGSMEIGKICMSTLLSARSLLFRSHIEEAKCSRESHVASLQYL